MINTPQQRRVLPQPLVEDNGLVTDPNDPSPIGSGNWIGNWSPEEIANIASLGDMGQVDDGRIAQENALTRGMNAQMGMIDSEGLSGVNQYQQANLSGLGTRREAEATRDFQLNELRNARDTQARTLERNTAEDIAARRATFQPELNKLKALFNARGILNSSAFNDAVAGLQGGIDAYSEKAQRNLQDRLSTINETFNSRVTSLGNVYQTKIDNIENLLTKRLESIESSKAATNKAKLQARMTVMKDYQSNLEKIRKEYADKAASEEKQRQQAFDNEVKIAGLTGMFRGNPTLSAQRFAADEAYRAEQLALAQMRARKSGSRRSSSSSSSSIVTGNNPLAKFYNIFREKVANKIDPKVAETQVLAMLTKTKDKAAMRQMIEDGPADWTYAEGPVMEGGDAPLAAVPNGRTWADVVNPKKKNSGLTPGELELLKKFS